MTYQEIMILTEISTSEFDEKELHPLHSPLTYQEWEKICNAVFQNNESRLADAILKKGKKQLNRLRKLEVISIA